MKNNYFEKIQKYFLKFIFSLLLGKEEYYFYERIDWQEQIASFQKLNLNYPLYYSSQNFHGVQNGYLNPVAAITYDLVTALATPPNENWIRCKLIATINCQPKFILDLGCGTGSTTFMLKQAFPSAVVTGLDLSPYMLVVANFKANKAQLDIQWLHGLGEKTSLSTDSLDLVTVCFLLHETPSAIAQLILQECFRLLKPGGQLLILDGNQKRLYRSQWLIKLFQEPYSKAYAQTNLEELMRANGFENIQIEYVCWINQITSGTKPINILRCPAHGEN